MSTPSEAPTPPFTQLHSTIFFPPQLRAQWPSPLTTEWAEAYPAIFDADDIRNTLKQPKNHFYEWFAAVHLFHRDGALSLVEKYLFNNHTRKAALIRELLTEEQLHTLVQIHRDELKIQPPDLLVFTPDRRRIWFAEVKGPGDTPRPRQPESQHAIRTRLGLPVELITVRQLAPPSAPDSAD
jgi:hypothetical protein